MSLAVRVGFRIHGRDPRVRRERFIQGRSSRLRRANQKQVGQTRRRGTAVILVVVRVVARDIIEIPELLLRLLSISFKGLAPRPLVQRDAAVREQEFFSKCWSSSLGMLHELEGFDAILGALE